MAINVGGFNIPINLPSISTGGFGTAILYVLVAILLISIVCVGIWFWYMNKLYNKKVVVFENISGKGWQRAFEDTARLIKVGDQGEELLYLRNRKVYRTAYGKKMGVNEYWFAVGQDGYWYNYLLGDFDAKLGEMDIEPVDRDMRYMHVAIRKNIENRYKKK